MQRSKDEEIGRLRLRVHNLRRQCRQLHLAVERYKLRALLAERYKLHTLLAETNCRCHPENGHDRDVREPERALHGNR